MHDMIAVIFAFNIWFIAVVDEFGVFFSYFAFRYMAYLILYRMSICLLYASKLKTY